MLAGTDGKAVCAGSRNEEEVRLKGLPASRGTSSQYPSPFQNDVFRNRQDPVREPGPQHPVDPDFNFGLEHRVAPAFGVVPERGDCGGAQEEGFARLGSIQADSGGVEGEVGRDLDRASGGVIAGDLAKAPYSDIGRHKPYPRKRPAPTETGPRTG